METIRVVGINPTLRRNLRDWTREARTKEADLDALLSEINTGAISATEAYNALTYMKQTGIYQMRGIGCLLLPFATSLGGVLGETVFDNNPLAIAGGALIGLAGTIAVSYKAGQRNFNGDFHPVATGHVDALIEHLENNFFYREKRASPRPEIRNVGNQGGDTLLIYPHTCSVSYLSRGIPFGELLFPTKSKDLIHEDTYDLVGEEDSRLSVRVITDRHPSASVRATRRVRSTDLYVLPAGTDGMIPTDTHSDILTPTRFTHPLHFEKEQFERYAAVLKPYFTFQTA